MKAEEFLKSWNLLIINYGEKYNTPKNKNFYYHYLKDYKPKELFFAVEESIRNYRFFPNINEIIAHMPSNRKDEFFWNGKKCEKQVPTENELIDINKLLANLEV